MMKFIPKTLRDGVFKIAQAHEVEYLTQIGWVLVAAIGDLRMKEILGQ